MKKKPRILMWIDVGSNYGRGIANGIAKYSSLHGPWTFEIEPPFFSQAQDVNNITAQMVKESSCDAVIMGENEHLSEIVKMGLPVVLTHYNKKVIPAPIYLSIDEVAVGEMAADHLLGLGFKNFACCGFMDTSWLRTRGKFFARKVKEKGFLTNYYKGLLRNDRSEGNRERLKGWLESLQKPIGIMASDDDCGRYILEVCSSYGLEVPDEIAVVSVDNDELPCNLSTPSLSSIHLNSESAGYEAAKALSKMLNSGFGEEESKVVVSPNYVVARRSSDTLAIEDCDVAKALCFIRSHAHEPIQAVDVAEAVAMSRSALYERFRRVLNCTIYERIKRARLEQVVRMLMETDEPISQISVSLGFSSIEHLSRFFHNEKGVTPTAYRRIHSEK